MLALSMTVLPSALYMGFALALTESSTVDHPYVTLGIAGVILGLIVVPTVKWQLNQLERQQATQENLAADLKRSVDLMSDMARELKREAQEQRQESVKQTALLTALAHGKERFVDRGEQQ